MKLTEDKLRKKIRSVIKEQINIQKGRTQPPALSVNGHINKFMERTIKKVAGMLQNNYDIEFQDAILGDRSFQSDFQVYNRRQDLMKEGRMFMFAKDGTVTVQVEGGPLGSSISEMQRFIDEDISYNEDPTKAIDFVSAFQVLAGR